MGLEYWSSWSGRSIWLNFNQVIFCIFKDQDAKFYENKEGNSERIILYFNETQEHK